MISRAAKGFADPWTETHSCGGRKQLLPGFASMPQPLPCCFHYRTSQDWSKWTLWHWSGSSCTGEEASGQREEATCPSQTGGLQLALEGSSLPCQWINMTFRDTQTSYWLWVFLAQHEALFVKSPAKWKEIPSFPLTSIKIEMFLLKRPQQHGLLGLEGRKV